VAASSAGNIVGYFTLGFMTIWLTFWSLGVGLLSSLLTTEGGILWLFIVTHGGAEIGVAWMLAASFARAAEQAVGGPELSLGLSELKASWGFRGRSLFLLGWFGILGLFIGLVLALGTWLPVVGDATVQRLVVASALSVAWGVIGWRWVKTLRLMRRTLEQVTVEATFDRVEVVRSIGVTETVHTFPAAELSVSADGHRLTFQGPEESVSLLCAPTPERDQLVDTLREMSARAVAEPFENPPLPEALAALRRTPEAT